MGSEESSEPAAPQYRVQDGFEREQFQKQRQANTPELVLGYLAKLGTDLSKLSSKVPLPLAIPHAKILFIVCNTYTTEKYKLGVGPLNDSLTVAVNHKRMGYDIFYLHNTTANNFRDWLKLILKNAQSDLTIFYTGHGCSVKDDNGDESDGYDEVMLFDDSYVRDDDLARYLREYRHETQRTILLTDCCHSGSIWDLQSAKSKKINMPANILSISAAKDDQTAKQVSLDSKDQGIFSFYFWKFWNENKSISTTEMKAKLDPFLSRYSQILEFSTTTSGMEKDPIFPAGKDAKDHVEAPNEGKHEEGVKKNAKSRDAEVNEENVEEKPAAAEEEKPAAKEEKPAEEEEKPAAEEEKPAAEEE